MKNNILKKVTSLVMVPIIGFSASSCADKQKRYTETANYYSDTFVEDKKFDILYEFPDDNIPMQEDNNPLILIGRFDFEYNEINWLIGYLTYDLEIDKVYFYDVNKKDKLDLEKLGAGKYATFYVTVEQLGLVYEKHIPLSVLNKLAKSAKLDPDMGMSSVIFVDPNTKSERSVASAVLDFTSFKYISENENSTKKLVKTK